MGSFIKITPNKKRLASLLSFFIICLSFTIDCCASSKETLTNFNNNNFVHFGFEEKSFPQNTAALLKYLLKRSQTKYNHLKIYLRSKAYQRSYLTNELLKNLTKELKALNQNKEELNGIVQFEKWLYTWLAKHYQLKPIEGQIVVAFNIHSNHDLNQVVELFHQLKKRK